MPRPDHRPRDSPARADDPAGYPVALDGAGLRGDLLTVERSERERSGPLEVHVVDGRPPVAAPLPTSIGEDVYGGIAAMQKARVGAAAVQVCRRILRLECARGVNVRIEKWVDVNSPTIGVPRPSAGSRDVSAAERRRVV